MKLPGYTLSCNSLWYLYTNKRLIEEYEYTGPSTNNAPFYYKNFYFKIISMYFCNITISHSSTPYDIVGEMFKIKLDIITPILLPYQPHSGRRYFCRILDVNI